MMDFLNNFKSLVKLETVRTDNNVFRLHYKLTVIVLIVFSILLTSKQYFGEPIQCQTDAKDILPLIQTYCWIYGTYIIKDTVDNHNWGVIPGLGNTGEQYPWSNRTDSTVIWQKYYQWVCIVLCFQALLFYLPRYIWKTWEGGRLRLLVSDFMLPLVPTSWNSTAKNHLLRNLMEGKELHKLYAMRYTFCEVLNLTNVVCQIFLMDWLLTGQFSWYGISLIFSAESHTAMNQVFPKITKCTYYKYGPSGGHENRDCLCLLPLNVLNEKLFLILWCWFFLLSCITCLSLVYRTIVFAMPTIRVYLLMAQARSITKRQATFIVKKLSYGDFFILYQVGKNINPTIYREVVVAIHDALKSKNHQYYPGFDSTSP